MPQNETRAPAMPWRARGHYRSLEGALGAACRTSAESDNAVVTVVRGPAAFLLVPPGVDPEPGARIVAFVKAHASAGSTRSK